MIQVEYVNAEDLKPAVYNPRTMSDDAMARLVKLLDAHGIVDPLIARRSDNMLIGGHQRLKANSMRATPDEKVPVVYLDVTDEQAKALNVALNNPKAQGEYDYPVLADILQELDTGEIDVAAITGFTEQDIAELMHGLDEAKHEGEDNIPEPQEYPVTITGDLWIMGEHRLLCGDCRESETTNTGAVIYDPPWDSDPAISVCGDALVFCDAATIGCVIERWGSPLWVFAWDCVTSWYLPNRPLKRMKLALWYGVWDRFDFDGSHYGEPGESKTVTNSRGQYDYVADPRGKHLADVFVAPITQEHSEGPSHSKPLDWIRLLIGCCMKGDVYDPFSGSGTTIIACEQLNRKCYAIEIEPRYVDVAVKRWQNYTNEQATLDGDGRTFAEIEAERTGNEQQPETTA